MVIPNFFTFDTKQRAKSFCAVVRVVYTKHIYVRRDIHKLENGTTVCSLNWYILYERSKEQV